MKKIIAILLSLELLSGYYSQMGNLFTDGNVIHVGGAMSFGVLVNNENNFVEATQRPESAPVPEFTTAPPSDVTPSLQSAAPTEESSSAEDELTETEPPPTEPPLQECANFSPMGFKNFRVISQEFLRVHTSTFDECCSQVDNRTVSFSYANESCTYYYFDVEAFLNDPSPIGGYLVNDDVLYVRNENPRRSCIYATISWVLPHGYYEYNGEAYLKCDNGVLYFENENGAFPLITTRYGRYYISPPQESFRDAKKFCEENGAPYLFFRRDPGEMYNVVHELFDFLDLLPPFSWVDLRKDGTEGEYIWAYNLIIEKNEYNSSWSKNAPMTADCVQFSSNKDDPGLFDRNCDASGYSGLCLL